LCSSAIPRSVGTRAPRKTGRRFSQWAGRAAGDYESYVAELEDALAQRPDHPGTLYNLACAEALAGRPDDAIAHLTRALEQEPEWRVMAADDEDFAALRDRPDWPA